MSVFKPVKLNTVKPAYPLPGNLAGAAWCRSRTCEATRLGRQISPWTCPTSRNVPFV